MKSVIYLFIIVFITGIVSSCIPDGKLKIDFNMTPIDIGDGWDISTPQTEGFNHDDLTEAYNLFFSEDDFTTAISLLVIRNNRLIAEGYCRNLDDRTLPEHVQSVTKSFTAAVFGIARSLGYFNSLDAFLKDYIPDKFSNNSPKDQITIEHLLTMKSGIDFDNEHFTDEIIIDEIIDPVSHILEKPMYNDPGAVFYYRDADPHLLSAAIQEQSGLKLQEMAHQYLFSPMGINDYIWLSDYDEQDAHNVGAFGLFIRPRDLGKFGKLIINDGDWNGEQLIPSAWINAMTSYQTDAVQDYSYGYYWWIIPDMRI